jgi:purine nucleosidase
MTKMPWLDEVTRLNRLTPPTGRVSMVLDTDTYNEIDDQFAVVHALLSPDQMEVEAIYAAPFHNSRSTGPADGMEKSHEEILRLLERLGRSPEGFVHKGSQAWLGGPDQPVESPAARDLVRRAMAEREGPLYVTAIGAITNVASAILMEPKIVERIVVVWLGGQPYDWPSAAEFNLQQDMHASRLIFDCGVPLVHIPCQNVAEHIRTTQPEMEKYTRGQGAIGDYLCQIFGDYFKDHYARSKVLWDISTTAWLCNPAWVPSALVHSPILTDRKTYSRDTRRHLVRLAHWCNRDAIFADVFRKLERAAK